MDLGAAMGHAITHWPAPDDPYGLAPDTSAIHDEASKGIVSAGAPPKDVRPKFAHGSGVLRPNRGGCDRRR